jgi:hypothetical protein
MTPDDPAAARAPARLADSSRAVHRVSARAGLLPAAGAARARDLGRGDGGAARARLAGQRARAAQRHRARPPPSATGRLLPEHLPHPVPSPLETAEPRPIDRARHPRGARRATNARACLAALARVRNQSRAARQLGISRKVLIARLEIPLRRWPETAAQAGRADEPNHPSQRQQRQQRVESATSGLRRARPRR